MNTGVFSQFSRRFRGRSAGQCMTLPLAVLFLCGAPLLADNAGSAGDSGGAAPSLVPRTPEQLAIEAYNDGIRNREKAWKAEEKARELSGDKQTKAMSKVEGSYANAAKRFQVAVEHNPKFYQAYGELGYSLRRLRRYDEALVAYDQALALNPNYPEALEYRAEAYLGLGRVGDAQASYGALRSVAPEQSAKLLAAMTSWIAARRADGRIDGAQLEALSRWVTEQRAVAPAAGAPSAW